MNYTELCERTAATVVSSFAPADFEQFALLAEQKIYTATQSPGIRQNANSTLTVANPYLTLPSDYLYTFSLSVNVPGQGWQFLYDKDVNFLREAYPNPAEQGVPRFYARFDEFTAMLAPTPASAYQVELHYAGFPESVTTAGTTWLSEHYGSVLLNGMILEASRFLKEEEDVLKAHEKAFNESLALFKNLADGKMRQDTYRTPQVRTPVQ